MYNLNICPVTEAEEWQIGTWYEIQTMHMCVIEFQVCKKYCTHWRLLVVFGDQTMDARIGSVSTMAAVKGVNKKIDHFHCWSLLGM